MEKENYTVVGLIEMPFHSTWLENSSVFILTLNQDSSIVCEKYIRCQYQLMYVVFIYIDPNYVNPSLQW